MSGKTALSATALLIIAGCTAYTSAQFEKRYGAPAPRDRVVDAVPAGGVDYWDDVKPVMEQRCIVCHACYDAPCQLKLSSIEGIERGASPAVVYDQSRLTQAQPTRLFEDAHSITEWRDLGFHPVLNEYTDTPEANREASVMHRILALKQQNPLPAGKTLPESFDFQLNRDQFCAKPDTFDEFSRKYPLWGMPYGLPGLDAERQSTLLRWLEQGAIHTARPPLPAEFADEISIWETFLNGNSLKAQLAGRYIYEHLFLSHLYFPDLDPRRFFKIVRSATPPGEPVEPIATRRPYNDPGVERVYYRLIPELGTIVAKTHMPYALDGDRLETWRELFVEADYAIDELPSYAEELASNPFRTFDAMPVASRYGSCSTKRRTRLCRSSRDRYARGQVALNVINDRFWVFFIDPDDAKTDNVENFLVGREEQFAMPASTENIYNPVSHWRRYSKQQKELLAAADEYLTEHMAGTRGVSLDLVWDGDGTNDNAALTVFRHFDSATVEKGPDRQAAENSLDHRIRAARTHPLPARSRLRRVRHVGHQLMTRIYMDFLRMEGETNFLLMLPQEARDRERDYWYREADKEIAEYMTLPRFESEMTPAISYRTSNPKLELYDC